MQHNLTRLQVKGKMTRRKNAKMLTVFAVSLLGMKFRFVCSFVFAALITRNKTNTPKNAKYIFQSFSPEPLTPPS